MLSDDEHALALTILEDLGKAQPAVIPAKFGELKHSPVPSGLAPIHQSMLALIKTEQSKMVLGSTLSVEIGSNGSYAAADVHADGLVDTQRIYSSLTADAFRSQPVRWFLQANAERLAAAFNRYVPGGCSPQDIVNEAPIIEWVLSDETPAQRLQVFQGVKGLDLKLDEEQVIRTLSGLRGVREVRAGVARSGDAVSTTIAMVSLGLACFALGFAIAEWIYKGKP